MVFLKLKGTRQIYCQDKSFLTIQYYLVQTIYDHKPIYGIQIHSYRDNNIQKIHAESIQRISYSKSYVAKLLSLCMKNLVTPTDLFSSIDILMDTITE